MKEKWLELTESLGGEYDALTLAQIEYIVELFESGVSGDFVARILKGEFAEIAYRIVVNVSLSPFIQQTN